MARVDWPLNRGIIISGCYRAAPLELVNLHPFAVEISSPTYPNFLYQSNTDGHSSLNTSSTATSNLSLAPRTYGHSSEHLASVHNNGFLNTSPSNRVVELAAHYGIPQSLPKPPKPNLRPEPAFAAQSYSAMPEFVTMRQNYLNMLSNNPPDDSAASTGATGSAMDPAPQSTPLGLTSDHELQPVLDILRSSPEFKMAQNFGEYLTSPLGTPYDDFSNTSPMDDSPFISDLNTPIMDHIDNFESSLTDPTSGWTNEDLSRPLFDDASLSYYNQVPVQTGTEVKEPPQSTAAELLANHKLYSFSPSSPALEDFNSPVTPHDHSPVMRAGRSLYSSPRVPTSSTLPPHSTSSVSTRNKSRGPSLNATGTRKDISPETMVPYDAPTQSRNYLTPSATSRKVYPSHAARKRSHTEAFDDHVQEQDELTGEAPPGPNASEMEHIEWKRRQNTLAARKSRKRKLEHLRELEHENTELKQDRDRWKVRCGVLEGVLKANGMAVPKWDED
ncbi:hypothetical protein GYMLUDRAFT_62209 [Collybiopsis luxurians FD-317 M1]|uniref:BZIP domain-containing protein n=1 Tax=Collybiopsis luxurians FD-317 M1 TaxID=944289 RepID=A0A0D0AZK3_9AGAR|nr:hypothetical protein GYMLUDRAFT_62209 [Collybiopsis luxurians FD-317 M1]